MILIGRDGNERRLGEDERLVFEMLQVAAQLQTQLIAIAIAAMQFALVGPLDHVHARLILVHRVEHNL